MGEDRRPGGRRGRARARARPAARGRHGARDAGRRVPAPLPDASRSRPSAEREPAITDPGPARRRAARGRDHRRRRRRLPAAAGRRARRVRPRRRTTTSPTTRGGSRCSAAWRWRRWSGTACRSTCSTSTTGTPARRSSSGRGRGRGQPVLHRDGRRWSRSTTSPTTAGRATRSSTSWGSAPGDPFGGDNADGIDLLLTAIERAELANTVSPGVRPRVADARVRDGPRRRAAGEGRPLPRDPQRHRPRRLEPGDRPGARRPVRAAPRQARPPVARTCSSATGWTRPTTGSCSG